MSDLTDTQIDYIREISKPDFAGPSHPLYVKQRSWDDITRELEDHIRNNDAFEGKWQSYLNGYQLVIPAEMRDIFRTGGVLTASTENHLLLFGKKHWERLQRNMAKMIGLSPVNNSLARHIYEKAYRFDRLNTNGTIDVPISLVQYAGIESEVAIIGLVYQAEIHDKKSYVASQQPEQQSGLLDRFKKMKYN